MTFKLRRKKMILIFFFKSDAQKGAGVEKQDEISSLRKMRGKLLELQERS